MIQVLRYRLPGNEAPGRRPVEHGDRPALVALFELREGRLRSAGDDRVDEMNATILRRTLENFEHPCSLRGRQSRECCRGADDCTQGFNRRPVGKRAGDLFDPGREKSGLFRLEWSLTIGRRRNRRDCATLSGEVESRAGARWSGNENARVGRRMDFPGKSAVG